MRYKDLERAYPILKKVYNAIKEVDKQGEVQRKAFQRQVDLIPAWRKLEQEYEEIEKRKTDLQGRLNNKRKELEKEYANEETGKVPKGQPEKEFNQKFNEFQGEINVEFSNFLSTEITSFKNTLKFTEEEVMKAKLDSVELAVIWEFVTKK